MNHFSFAAVAIKEVAREHGTSEKEVINRIAEALSIPKGNPKEAVTVFIDLAAEEILRSIDHAESD